MCCCCYLYWGRTLQRMPNDRKKIPKKITCVTKGAILCIIDSLKWSIEWRSTKTIEQRKIRKNKSEFHKLIYIIWSESEQWTEIRNTYRIDWAIETRMMAHNIHNRPLERWQWPHFCSCWLHYIAFKNRIHTKEQFKCLLILFRLVFFLFSFWKSQTK